MAKKNSDKVKWNNLVIGPYGRAYEARWLQQSQARCSKASHQANLPRAFTVHENSEAIQIPTLNRAIECTSDMLRGVIVGVHALMPSKAKWPINPKETVSTGSKAITKARLKYQMVPASATALRKLGLVSARTYRGSSILDWTRWWWWYHLVADPTLDNGTDYTFYLP